MACDLTEAWDSPARIELWHSALLVIVFSASTIASIVFRTESGLSEMLSIPCATRNCANSGQSLGACPLDTDLATGTVGRTDHLGDCPRDGIVAFIEEMRDEFGIAIDAQD